MSNPMTAESNTLQESHDQIHTVSTTTTTPASTTVSTTKTLLDHFQYLTFVRLRPCSVENSAHRRNGAAFFPNDFADVLLCHTKLDDDRVFPLNTSHMHFLWFLHNGPGNLLNQFLHGKPLSTDSTIGLLAQPPHGAAYRDILPLLQVTRLSQHQGAHGMRVALQRRSISMA